MSMDGGAPEVSEEGADTISSAALDALMGGGRSGKGMGVAFATYESGAPQGGMGGGGAKRGRRLASMEGESPTVSLGGGGSGSGESEGPLEGGAARRLPSQAIFPSSSQIQSAAEALSLSNPSGLTISIPILRASISLEGGEGGGGGSSKSFHRRRKMSRGSLRGEREGDGGSGGGGKVDADGMNLSSGGGDSSKGGRDCERE